jgi:hypothetical protein
MRHALGAILLFIFGSASAASINVDAFSGNESVEDFSTLGSPPTPGSFSFGGMTFSESSTGGGSSGWRLIYDSTLTDNAGITNMQIDFDTAWKKVGLDVGFFPTNGPATTFDVSFFDTTLDLLGTVTVSGIGGLFAGWADSAGISRIVLVETSGDNGHVGGVDNIRFENASAVPIPAAAYLFASGLGLLGWFRRKAVINQKA